MDIQKFKDKFGDVFMPLMGAVIIIACVFLGNGGWTYIDTSLSPDLPVTPAVFSQEIFAKVMDGKFRKPFSAKVVTASDDVLVFTAIPKRGIYVNHLQMLPFPGYKLSCLGESTKDYPTMCDNAKDLEAINSEVAQLTNTSR